jgi:hypothetical protein
LCQLLEAQTEPAHEWETERQRNWQQVAPAFVLLAGQTLAVGVRQRLAEQIVLAGEIAKQRNQRMHSHSSVAAGTAEEIRVAMRLAAESEALGELEKQRNQQLGLNFSVAAETEEEHEMRQQLVTVQSEQESEK